MPLRGQACRRSGGDREAKGARLLGAIVAGVIVGAVVLAWWMRPRGADAAERELGRRCMGSTAQATRLIEHELQRRPGISRAQAAARALESLRRDRS